MNTKKQDGTKTECECGRPMTAEEVEYGSNQCQVCDEVEIAAASTSFVQVEEYPSERPLEDDYPVHYGYWYVADGEPKRCELGATDIAPATVFELRINWNVGEIRNCDLKSRGMLDQVEA